jgi:hypothetical protein
MGFISKRSWNGFAGNKTLIPGEEFSQHATRNEPSLVKHSENISFAATINELHQKKNTEMKTSKQTHQRYFPRLGAELVDLVAKMNSAQEDKKMDLIAAALTSMVEGVGRNAWAKGKNGGKDAAILDAADAEGQ